MYLGSSRMGPDHSHYLQVLELGREVRAVLSCLACSKHMITQKVFLCSFYCRVHTIALKHDHTMRFS